MLWWGYDAFLFDWSHFFFWAVWIRSKSRAFHKNRSISAPNDACAYTAKVAGWAEGTRSFPISAITPQIVLGSLMGSLRSINLLCFWRRAEFPRITTSATALFFLSPAMLRREKCMHSCVLSWTFTLNTPALVTGAITDFYDRLQYSNETESTRHKPHTITVIQGNEPLQDMKQPSQSHQTRQYVIKTCTDLRLFSLGLYAVANETNRTVKKSLQHKCFHYLCFCCSGI